MTGIEAQTVADAVAAGAVSEAAVGSVVAVAAEHHIGAAVQGLLNKAAGPVRLVR